MNKKDVLDILDKYNFDRNEIIILSGASMVLQDVKDKTNDLDISVSKEYYKVLEKKYNCTIEKQDSKGNNIYYIEDKINFGLNYYNMNETVLYKGYHIQSLSSIKKLKQLLGREKDYKDIKLIDNFLEINPLVLAYLGDSVYEVYIRKYLIDKGICKVNDLQRKAKEFVSAKSQARILNDLINDNVLNEEELDIVRKGRNSKSHKAPKNTDIITYKQATGFETLIGYLYQNNDIERIKNIIKEIIGE